ncbi:MAG: serine/threonine-protein kinase [Polyangiaceae bacterium]
MSQSAPTSHPLDSSLPKVGDLLAGKYRIERVLGQGGMGIVFAANHELLGVRVAVKCLLSDIASSTEAVTRFVNEAKNAAKIQSDNVARVMDVGTLDGGRPYMVIEFLEGDDLSKLLEQRGVLSVQEAVDYVLQALEGLAQAHSIGIVHRDLKPANLFLVKRQDRTMQVKVLDFGISKATNPLGEGSGAMTSTKALLGSPYYMSPEQLRSSKSVDARADIWSVGIILYELLTGAPPFAGDNFGELFAAILEMDAPSLLAKRPDINPQFEHVVMRCLQRKPDNRYSNVGELAAALAPFASTRGQRTAHRILDVMPIGDRPASVSPGAQSMVQNAPNYGAHASGYGGSPGSGQMIPGASTGSGVFSAPGVPPPGVQTNSSWTGAQALPQPRQSSVGVALLIGGLVVGLCVAVGVAWLAAQHNKTTAAALASASASASAIADLSNTPAVPTATTPPDNSAVVPPTAPTTTVAAAQDSGNKPLGTDVPSTHHNDAQSSHHHDTPAASVKPTGSIATPPPAHSTAPAHSAGVDPFGGGSH